MKMKYNNPLTKELLKEFRSFQKWAPGGYYAFFKDEDCQENFNKKIEQILRRHKMLKK